MKAAILTAVNAPLQLVEPEILGLSYGQVFVRILASGICGAQLQEIRGEKGTHFPRLMGHEGCGIVEEVGPGVTRVKVGDKVCMHWRKGDGIECESPEYLIEGSNGRIVTGGQVVTFADFSICSENRLTVVPAETPVEFATLMGCSLSTALGTIESEANLKMGETVLIIGCGGLGLNLILAAKMRRASYIMGVDIVEYKADAALDVGANATCASVAGLFFDVVIDTTGDAKAISMGLECLEPSGRFILVGQPKPGVSVPINNARHLFEGEGCSIKATQGGMFQPSRDIPRYVRLYESGQLDLTGIISHRIPLSEINSGIDLVRNGQAGRILIEP